MTLQTLRRRVDRLDDQLVRLLNRRTTLALSIGRIKQRERRPVYDARREAAVLARVGRMNRGPLSAAAVRRLFRVILVECRRRERAAKPS